jgi:O-methyltransferase
MAGTDGSGAKALLKRVLPKKVVRSISRLRSGVQASYGQDGLWTVHNCDFIKDRRFMRAYQAGKSTGSWGDCEIHWRAYVACWAANKGTMLKGDFVECGVNKGGLARAIVDYVAFGRLNKTFYLFDTYSGLCAEYASAPELNRYSETNPYEECYESVVATFRPFANVAIVRGPVPDTLSQVSIERVSYLSIDMNCAAPERAALEFFWDKLTSGATVVLDDYGWKSFEAQKISADEFAASKSVQVLALPTGQGLIFKP